MPSQNITSLGLIKKKILGFRKSLRNDMIDERRLAY